MGPDWFTVIAQIVNFLILVALLKRFLYGPIIRAMDRREAEIAARLDSAARKSAEAEQERLRYETLAHELLEEKEGMRARARGEADALRRELMQKAREEVDRGRTQWLESLRGERESFFRSLRCHVCEQVCAVSRIVLKEMADASLEERMASCLERRIRAMGEAESEELAAHFRAAGERIIVRSAFEMSTEGRKTIIRALESLADDTASIRFEVEPSLVCGVDIRAGGRSLTWNLEEHLDNLEERLVEAMGKDIAINGKDSPARTENHGN